MTKVALVRETSAIAEILGYTTDPVRGLSDNWWGKLVKAWKGVEERDPETVEARAYHFGQEFDHWTVEALHNAALDAGFESEIVYYDTGYDVRVRRPGDDEPSFYVDRLRE